MDNRMKNVIYSAILLIAVVLVWFFRDRDRPVPVKIDGKTMGTTYHITYFDDRKRDFKPSIDSLLLIVNQSINTYDSTSEVSVFNRSQRGIAIDLPYLLPPLKKAMEVYKASGGAFDPTVMPLVNAWGFGYKAPVPPSSIKVDSLLQWVGLDKVSLKDDSVLKSIPGVQLDFGGIGQGYGADVITGFLKSKRVVNFMVELGGEGIASGLNLERGSPWEIGILDPNSTYENQFLKAIAILEDKAYTTSGNYFNYREVEGKKFSHTIDPQTGRPTEKAILSASVFADDCTTADAWATALMVLGHEKAIELLKGHPELDALLIYSGQGDSMETYMTPGIQGKIKLNPKP